MNRPYSPPEGATQLSPPHSTGTLIMSCDIHAFYEIKVGNRWLHYGQANFRQNYDFFARIADVRNWPDSGITPISKPRGLPDDISEMTCLHNDHWGVAGHSHSWLSANEYTKVIGEFKVQELNRESHPYGEPGEVYLFGNPFHTFSEYPDDYPDFIQDFRLVFWFDN